jgi:hypothetical protein
MITNQTIANYLIDYSYSKSNVRKTSFATSVKVKYKSSLNRS